MVEQCMTDGQLKLTNSSIVPVVIGACNKHQKCQQITAVLGTKSEGSMTH